MSQTATSTEQAKAELAKAKAERAEAVARRVRAQAQIRAIRRLSGLASGGGGGRPGGSGPSMAAGSYATERGRSRDPRRALGGSADYHLDGTTRRELVRDSQRALRRDLMARILVRAVVRMVVGKGPTIRPGSADDDFNRRKAALWAAWAANDGARVFTGPGGAAGTAGRCDARGLQTLDRLLRTVVRAAITDGDVLPVYLGPEDGLQLVEGERILSPVGTGATLPNVVPGRGGWVHGIEVDALGRPQRAAVFPYDRTGSTVRLGGLRPGGRGAGLAPPPPSAAAPPPEYVDLTDGNAYLFRNPLSEPTNATRGEPAMAAVLPRLDELAATDEAVRTAYRVAACVAGFLEHPNPAQAQSAWIGTNDPRPAEALAPGATARGSGLDVVAEIEPGLIYAAPLGAKLSQVTPQFPSINHKSWELMQYGQIGADLGAPILLAMMDATESNYSGFRAMIALAYEGAWEWRKSLDALLGWVERHQTAAWIRAGLLPLADGWDAPSHYVWPPMPNLDPLKEVQAHAQAIQAGLSSRDEAIHEWSGRDGADVDRERAAARARETELGLQPAAIQTNTPAAGAAPAAGQTGPGDDAGERDDPMRGGNGDGPPGKA